MKRWISIMLLAVMLLALCACGDSSSTEATATPSNEASTEAPEETPEATAPAPEVTAEPTPEATAEPTSEATTEPTPEATEVSAQSGAATPVDGTYALHMSRSNGWTAWVEEDFSSVIITPVYAEYIIEGKEKYPAKFIMFDKPADTALYELKYDSVIYINRGKNIIYTYYAYDRASFELFLEDVEDADIIDTGSDKSAIYWDADRETVNVMLDIKDAFGGTAKLVFSISDYANETSKEDMIELAKSELARIESTMEILEPGQFWSVGKFSTIDLYDDYAEVGVTVDVSGLTVVDIELERINLYADKDGSNYSVELDLGDYVSDGAAETVTPGGNTVLMKETEYTVYAYYQVGIGKRDQVYYLEIQIDATGDTAYALVDDIISRTTAAQ